MAARLRRIQVVASEYGITIAPPTGDGSHWMAKKAGHRTYPIPAHRGENSEIGDSYIRGFCRNFGIDLAEFRSKL